MCEVMHLLTLKLRTFDNVFGMIGLCISRKGARDRESRSVHPGGKNSIAVSGFA